MKKVLLGMLITLVVVSSFGFFRAAEAVVIPASARAQGGGGAFWHTDLAVYNPNTFDVYITVQFIPSGYEGTVNDPQFVDFPDAIAPGKTANFDDILSYFVETGSGALIVWGYDAGDADADIIATTRTYTPNSDATGTYGQGIPGLPWYYYADPAYSDVDLDKVIVMGMMHSDAFRTNLGIMNVSGRMQEDIKIEIFDDDGASVGAKTYTLGPLAQVQLNSILPNEFGVEKSDTTHYMAVVSIASSTDTNPGAGGTPVAGVIAYGSRVDNNTLDPTYLEASYIVRPNIDCLWPQE